jgi:hypothetical protein
MKRTGRPKLSDQKRRSIVVKVNLTKREKANISFRAEGKPLSVYLRERGLA